MSLLQRLDSYVSDWAHKNVPEIKGSSWIQNCQNPQHGHFQTNLAMIAAKKLKKNPRELGQMLADAMAKHEDLEPPQVAGPGFVNFKFKTAAIESALFEKIPDNMLNKLDRKNLETVVLDFSGPNVAKEMHVGHIRSTILGDTLARVFRALGHEVITDNHIGDWGTQFGKLLLGYKADHCPELDPENALAYMEALYQDIHAKTKDDEKLLDLAREELK
ncbi:MAG: arginine--tRNA ligase, partial [Verrucomicrobiota bacterium]